MTPEFPDSDTESRLVGYIPLVSGHIMLADVTRRQGEHDLDDSVFRWHTFVENYRPNQNDVDAPHLEIPSAVTIPTFGVGSEPWPFTGEVPVYAEVDEKGRIYSVTIRIDQTETWEDDAA